MKYEKSTTLPIKCHLFIFISVTIKDLNVVALRNGYRIFLKHVYTFVIGQYINTICSGGDLGSCKAALPTAGEGGVTCQISKIRRVSEVMKAVLPEAVSSDGGFVLQ